MALIPVTSSHTPHTMLTLCSHYAHTPLTLCSHGAHTKLTHPSHAHTNTLLCHSLLSHLPSFQCTRLLCYSLVHPLFCHSLLSQLVLENPCGKPQLLSLELSQPTDPRLCPQSVVSVAGVGSAQGVFSAAEPMHTEPIDSVLTTIVDPKRSKLCPNASQLDS